MSPSIVALARCSKWMPIPLRSIGALSLGVRSHKRNELGSISCNRSICGNFRAGSFSAWIDMGEKESETATECTCKYVGYENWIHIYWHHVACTLYRTYFAILGTRIIIGPMDDHEVRQISFRWLSGGGCLAC